MCNPHQPQSPSSTELYAEVRALYSWDRENRHCRCVGYHARELSYAEIMDAHRAICLHQRARLERELLTNIREAKEAIQRRNDEKGDEIEQADDVNGKKAKNYREDQPREGDVREAAVQPNAKMKIINLLN